MWLQLARATHSRLNLRSSGSKGWNRASIITCLNFIRLNSGNPVWKRSNLLMPPHSTRSRSSTQLSPSFGSLRFTAPRGATACALTAIFTWTRGMSARIFTWQPNRSAMGFVPSPLLTMNLPQWCLNWTARNASWRTWHPSARSYLQPDHASQNRSCFGQCE